MLLYIIRHGETDWNTEGKLQGWSNMPLNENGIKLAKLTAEGMKDVHFDLAISSPLDRAVDTARFALGDQDVPILTDDRLKEIRWGEWDGLVTMDVVEEHEDYKRFIKDPTGFQGAPGGESFQEVCDRTKEFYEELIHNPEYQNKTILISTHGCSVRALLKDVYNDPSDLWHGGCPVNCAVSIVSVEDGTSTLLADDKIFYDRKYLVNYYQVIGKE